MGGARESFSDCVGGTLNVEADNLAPSPPNSNWPQTLRSEVMAAIDSALEIAPNLHRKSPDLRSFAGLLFEARQRRFRHFPKDLLGEPAWDMLLYLYSQGSSMTVKSASLAGQVPQTTGFRWIQILANAGLIDKRADSQDKRKTLVQLNAAGIKLAEVTVSQFYKDLIDKI
jgi:DNA-binding MarR family transcriptional regulator